MVSATLVSCFVAICSIGVPGGTPGWSAPVVLNVGEICHYHIVADLNNDGRPDIVVPTRSSGSLHVFLNAGAGSFSPDQVVGSLPDTISVAAADIDGDGDRDLLAVGFSPGVLRVHVNDGSASFTNGPDYPLGGKGHGIDVADFDGDGRVDVVITTAEGIDRAEVLWNNGAGGFVAGPILATQQTPYYVTAADIDDDHDADVVISNWASDSISVHRNDGALGFTLLGPYGAGGPRPGRVLTADLDNDGFLDLVLPHWDVPTLQRYEAMPDGTLVSVETILGSGTGYSIDSADLDLDGRLDLAIGRAPGEGVAVSFQDGLGLWGAFQTLQAGVNQNRIELADLDGNGSPDITVSSLGNSAVVILFNGLFPDCNANGVPDPQDVASGSSSDCNGNAVPDECDLTSGRSSDCDADGELDDCEIVAQPSLDLDGDGTLDQCEVPGTSFCFGDGSLPTSCPCARPDVVPDPPAAQGHGCANSFNPAGALLTATGTTFPDTVTVTVDVASVYAGFAFLVKGNAAASVGVASADGIVCATGALVRFGGHAAGSSGNPPGQWVYPNAVQTLPISVATAQATGQSAFYQLYYRNAAAGFCTPATANWSNAYQIDWPR